jgi:spore maturation protein CgeB
MRILLVSTGFMGIADSYKNTIESLGHDCRFVNTNMINLDKKSTSKSAIIDARSDVVLQAFNDFNPDMVLDILGFNISKDVLSSIRKKSVIVKYLLDLIENYQGLNETLSLYEKVYTYETYDIDNIKKCGANNVDFLCAAFDSHKYYPLRKERDIDISFVGQMYNSAQKKRRLLLKKIAKDYPQLRCEFYGVFVRPYQIFRFLIWKIKDNGKVFKNYTIRSDEVNEIYNRSKICLNINSYQTHETWSSRLLEMMGTKSFVVTDSTKHIEQFLGKGVVCFNSYESLKSIINDYLFYEKGRDAVASKGFNIAQKYTIDRSISQIVFDYQHKER